MRYVANRSAGRRAKRTALACALVAMAAPVGSADALPGTAEQHHLVPAYFQPDWWNPANNWYRMCDGMNRSGHGSTAIMNPNSGPGEIANHDYQHVIDYCHDKGQNVVGYVHTSYGSRPSADVAAEIAAYYTFYPGIDGIFIDEMSNDPVTKAYYRSIYRYIRKASKRRSDVIGNPGIPADTSWQLDARVADEIIVFEGTAATYATWTPPAWVFGKKADEVAQIIVYETSDPVAVQDICRASEDKNAGLVFVTDNSMYSSLPWAPIPLPTCAVGSAP
jgi:hypothetical protein